MLTCRGSWRPGTSGAVGRDRGAASLEFTGVLVTVAVVVGALVAALLATSLGPRTAAAVCSMFDVGCTAAPVPEDPGTDVPTDTDYLPPPCMLSEDGEVTEGKIKIAFLEFGDDYGFIERTYADGRVTLTAVNGATLALLKSGDTQVVDIGRLDSETQVGGSLDVSGGIDMDYGDTWSFDDIKQADAMREQLNDYLAQQMAYDVPRAGGYTQLFDTIFGNTIDPPKPAQITFSTIGLDGDLAGSFGLQEPLSTGPDDDTPGFLDPNVGVEAALSADYDVRVETNHDTGERSYTYTLVGAGSVGGNLVVGEAGVNGSTTGAFKVTRDESGQITQIAMITTRDGGVKGGLEGSSPVPVPVGPSASGSVQESTATVTQVILDVDTAADRQVVQDWLSRNNEQFGTPLALTTNALVPTRGNPDDPFEQLLFQQAQVAQVTYDGVRDTQKFGLDVKAGWELGLSVTLDSWRKDAVEASYLGAPRADGARPMLTDPTCL